MATSVNGESPNKELTTDAPEDRQVEASEEAKAATPDKNSNEEEALDQFPQDEMPDDKELLISTVDLSTTGEKLSRIQFYRKGDRYFKGNIWGVSPQKFQTFQSSLVEFTNVPLKEDAGQMSTKYAFRSTVLQSLDNLNENENHYLASKEILRQLGEDVGVTEDSEKTRSASGLSVAPTKHSLLSGESRDALRDSRERTREGIRDKARGSREKASREKKEQANPVTPTLQMATFDTLPLSSSPTPTMSRTVVVIRNGCKPRRTVRFVLNSHSTHTFDQVVADMGDAVRSDTGTMKKVFGIDGVQVTNMADFFKEDVSAFIVYGPENPSPSDFEMDPVERRWVTQRSHDFFHISAVASAKWRRIAKAKVINKALLKEESSEDSQLQHNLEAENSLMYREIPLPDFEKNKPKPASEFWISYKLGDLCLTSKFSTTHFCTSKLPETDKTQLLAKVIEYSKSPEAFDRELELLSDIKHDHLVCLSEIFRGPDVVYVVFANNGGFQLVEAFAKMEIYSEKTAADLLSQLMLGVEYLHQNQIIHFNINHSAVMVSEDGTVLLGSFKKALRASDILELPRDTRIMLSNSILSYTAPEILAGRRDVSFSCDVYSAGVLLLVLLTGKFCTETVDQAYLDQNLELETGYSSSMKSLVYKCTGLSQSAGETDAESASRRSSASEILQFLKFNEDEWHASLPERAAAGLSDIAGKRNEASTPYVATLLFQDD